MKKVLMIVGSLRNNSFNHQLAQHIQTVLAGQAQVRFLDYVDVPFFNQDLEFPTPDSVAQVRQAVQEADGIWIVSPEYNYQIPGVLKNLLDWLSRPLVPNDRQRNSVMKGKFVTISGVAGKSAAAGVRANLSTLMEGIGMHLVAGTGTGVSLDGDAFQTGKLTLSDDAKAEIIRQAQEFLAAM